MALSTNTTKLNTVELKKFMKLMFKARKAVKVMGRPGVGKTQIARQHVAEERRKGPYFCSVLNAATISLGAVMGFLIPVDMKYGEASIKVGTWTMPYYFRNEDDGKPAFLFERGLIIIEEWGQASGEVKRALADLIHERRVGDHKLPDGFDIIVLSNRPEDRSGTTKEYDFLINRWAEVELVPTLEPLVDHFIDIGVSPMTMSFTVKNAEIVLASDVPDEQGPWATPRSVVAADTWILTCLAEGYKVDDDMVINGLESIFGKGTTAQYVKTILLGNSLPEAKDILRDPDGTFVPEAPDARMMLCHQLAHYAKRENLGTIIRYIERMPGPFAATFLKTVLRREPKFLQTKEVGGWLMRNTTLTAAIQPKNS